MRHVLILILACLPLLITAVEPAQIRAIADKTGPAVVTIRIVSTMKIAIMGQNRTLDHESEAVGVIVDPSGLTVTSVMDLDPSAMMKAVLGGNPMIKFDSTIKEIALRLADGSEIAAELALKDDDLGLAILRPTKPGQVFAALAPKAGAALQLGDRALVIGRAARHAASALMVVEFQAQGTVGGPQPYALVPEPPPLSRTPR